MANAKLGDIVMDNGQRYEKRIDGWYPVFTAEEETPAWDSAKANLEDVLGQLAERLEGKVSKRLWNEIFSAAGLVAANAFKAGVSVSYDKQAERSSGLGVLVNWQYKDMIGKMADLTGERATEITWRVLNYKNNS
jgi:hypothetical protein